MSRNSLILIGLLILGWLGYAYMYNPWTLNADHTSDGEYEKALSRADSSLMAMRASNEALLAINDSLSHRNDSLMIEFETFQSKKEVRVKNYEKAIVRITNFSSDDKVQYLTEYFTQPNSGNR